MRFIVGGEALTKRTRFVKRAAWLAFILVLISFGAGLAEEGARIEEVKLVPFADTFISSEHGGRERDERNINFGNQETLKVFKGKAERWGNLRGWKGTLIRFDLSNIPSDVEIEEARLFLYHYNLARELISIHRMEKDWMELGATWLKPCQGCEVWWRGWGGRNYLKRATDIRGVKKKGWYSWDVTEDVRSFSKGIPNYGWFLKSAMIQGEDWGSTRFYSKETNLKVLRPYLRIRFRSSVSPLMIKITSPANGAFLNENPVNVIGTVSDPSADVTVNGVTPSVSGNTFQASLNLMEGENSITAVAEDRYGQNASDRIDVTLITKGSIAGTVMDSSMGLPLASSTVSVTDSLNIPYTVITGVDGKYLISGIASGPFSGSITKGGYGTYPFSDIISPGQTITIDAALSPILPIISDVAAIEIANDSATISWITDQPGDSLVEYGPTPSYGISVTDSTLVKIHRIILRNLDPKTTYHFRVKSANEYGFSSYSRDASFTTLAPLNPITLKIRFPQNDDTISRADIRVEGTVTNATGGETGVVVNGVLANIFGDEFVANHVPLIEGSNTITAIAMDVDGNTETASVTLNGVKGENYIRITAGSELGIPPFEAVLTLESSLDLTNASLTYTGPAEVEFLSTSANEYKVKIITEGNYTFTARITDATGTLYEDTMVVTIMSRSELENRLGSKWDGMKSALVGGNIEMALKYFVGGVQDRYRAVFMELGDTRVNSIFSNILEIKLYTLSEGTAGCGAIRRESGGLYSYPVTFVQDENGIWKIMGF
jgi:hypothetical protein